MTLMFVGIIQNNTSNKVWGILTIIHNRLYLKFWGKLGTNYQTQIVRSSFNNMNRTVGDKIGSGYKSKTAEFLAKHHPDINQKIIDCPNSIIMMNIEKFTLEEFDYIKKYVIKTDT